MLSLKTKIHVETHFLACVLVSLYVGYCWINYCLSQKILENIWIAICLFCCKTAIIYYYENVWSLHGRKKPLCLWTIELFGCLQAERPTPEVYKRDGWLCWLHVLSYEWIWLVPQRANSIWESMPFGMIRRWTCNLMLHNNLEQFALSKYCWEFLVVWYEFSHKLYDQIDAAVALDESKEDIASLFKHCIHFLLGWSNIFRILPRWLICTSPGK